MTDLIQQIESEIEGASDKQIAEIKVQYLRQLINQIRFLKGKLKLSDAK